MVALNGPVYVQAPNPVVPRYGLFNVATGPLDLPVNARIGGVQYEVGTCTLPNGYEVNCQAEHTTKTFDGAVQPVSGAPFVVYASIECGAVGLANYGEQRVRQFLFQQLTSGEQATVENVFSTSTVGIGAGLANNPDCVDLGTAQGIVRGVAMLEDWLYGRYGLPGVMHVPMLGAAYVKGAHLVEKDNQGSPWRTEVGTAVSFGNYTGLGPTGQEPSDGHTWIYVTGQVAVWRTPDAQVFVPPLGQVMNRATNTVEIIMEREYVVTYDCYIAAVDVTLDTTDH